MRLTIHSLAIAFLPAFFTSAFAAPVDTTDTATRYLRAWTYRDYPAMYAMADKETRSQLSSPHFSRAAVAAGAPATEPAIVSRDQRDNDVHVYFEWPDGTTGERLRGSIILRHDGVYHPDVIARAPDVMPTVPGAPSTVDGETAESVLEKMERATADARSLKAEVVMRGAYLGQTVNETGELLWMSPGMFRLKTALFLVNCDGRRTLLVMPQLNTGMELSGLGELELSPGIGSSAKQLKSKYEIRLVSKGTAGGRQAFELVMRQPLQGLAGVIGSGRVRLWVDAQTWLPLRGEMDSLAVDYRNMQLNPPGITDASFAYSPPAGMNILSFGSLLGSLGSTGLPSSTPGDGP